MKFLKQNKNAHHNISDDIYDDNKHQNKVCPSAQQLCLSHILRRCSDTEVHFYQNIFLTLNKLFLRSWSKREVSVQLSSENLRTQQGCALLIKNAMKFGNVKAVFIVLDVNESNGEKDDFSRAYSNSCSVVLNLDLASRNCSKLRLVYFDLNFVINNEKSI